MEVSEQQKQDLRSIFSRVMEQYEQLRARAEHIGGLDTHPTPGKSQPCLSDFVCDVELAGRRVLNKAEFRFFKSIYCDQADMPAVVRQQEEFQVVEDRVMQKVGKEFKLKKIYPVGPYFRPKYADKRKRTIQ